MVIFCNIIADFAEKTAKWRSKVFQKVRRFFARARGKELTLNRVRDMITVREGNETIDLYVDSDANMLIRRLQSAQGELMSIDEDTSEAERKKAAEDFSTAIFGRQQTEKLLDFYHGDYGCVVTICGMYFGDHKRGLAKKITKVQMRGK
jgi:hypothetical protein